MGQELTTLFSPPTEETQEEYESVKLFFDRLTSVLSAKDIPKDILSESSQDEFWGNEKKVALFKAICVHDFMHAACDWESDCLEKVPYWEGKEKFGLDVMNYILDPKYPGGFFCDSCDDLNVQDFCEHSRKNESDMLQELLDSFENQCDEPYNFTFPNNQSEHLIERTKELFDNRKLNYGMFLDEIFTRYNEHVEDMCC